MGHWRLFLLIILATTPGVFYLATPIANQQQLDKTIQAVTVGPPMTTTTGSVSGCSLVLDTSDTPVTPTDGILTFGCLSKSGFTVSQSGNYTPTFTFSQYYVGLAVTPATTCIHYAATGQAAPTPITSGRQIQLWTTNPYFLCASYANVPSTGGTLPGFTITWSSGGTVSSQTFPTVTVPARTGTFQGCAATVFNYNYSGAAPVAGTLLFSCSISAQHGCWTGGCAIGTPAFNVSQTAYYTPTFSLSPYYTGLSLAGVNGCNPPMAFGGYVPPINSGKEILLGPGGIFVYCAIYENFPASGGTLSGFTISWSGVTPVFTQTIPSVSVPAQPPPPPALSECSPALASPAGSSITPNDGILNFGCAFVVNQSGNFRPTFTLPQFYTRLGIRAEGRCMIGDSPDPFWISGYGTPTIWTNLTSGGSAALGSPSTFYYCAAYANVPSSGSVLPSFTITWSNGTYTFPTQTFPALTIPQRTGTFVGCATTTVDPSESTPPATNGFGTLLLGCQGPPPICGSNCASIPAALDVSQTAYYTPTFALPKNYYTSIAVMGTLGCAPGHSQEPIPITSGTEVRLVAGVDYYYCLSYLNGSSGLPGFTVSWASGSTVFTQTIPQVQSSFPPQPLTINFDYSPASSLVGQGITFSGREVGGTPGYTLSWSFGDGSRIGGFGAPGTLVHSYSTPGTYSVSLTVNDSATPTHNTATVTKSVTVSASSNDPSISMNGSAIFQGVAVSTSGNVSVSSGIVSGSVSVTATNSSTGTTLFSKTYTISNLPLSNNITRFLLNVGVSPYPLSADIIVAQTGGVWSASVIVTRQLDIARRGTVDIVDFSVVVADYGTSLGGPRYNPAADVTGSGTVSIVDIGLFVNYYGAAVFY